MKKNIFALLKISGKYLLLFVSGFCLYTTIEVLFRGYSYPLMGLTGAASFICIDAINNKVSWRIPLIIQMLIGGFIITALELCAGIYSRYILNTVMWDYSDQFGNILGLICPLFSFLWFLLSSVAILLADAINYYVLHEPLKPCYYRICGKILFEFPERKCS